MSSVQLPPLDLRSTQPFPHDRSTAPLSKYKSGNVRSEKRSQSPIKQRFREVSSTSTREYSYLEPNSDRNTPRHNACLDVLMGGHVEAFIEFFGITSHGLNENVDTEEDLKVLQNNLTQAEIATRQNDHDTTYMSFKRIGDHFEKTEQLQRSRHFRQKAQRAAEDLDNFDRLALAHNALGLVEEKIGDIEMAVACFEDMYNTNLRGESDVKAACHNLVRTKTKLAEQCEANDDMESALALLKSALEYSLKLESAEYSAMCYYRLGRMSEMLSDADGAIQYLETYMTLSPTASGRNLACMVLARCYERRGDFETVLVYLNKLVDSSRELEQKQLEMDSTQKMGTIYQQQNDFGEAIKWYTIAYNCSRELNEPARILELRITLGTARAAALRQGYVQTLTRNTQADVATMLRWTSRREDAFSHASIDTGFPKPNTKQTDVEAVRIALEGATVTATTTEEAEEEEREEEEIKSEGDVS
eukprot:m.264489 g.264489  ORF g.264489 m.264489 type:complete len:475 (-) comp56539_c0_seq1:70-1494(-)